MRKTLERSLGFLAVFSISVNRDFREAQKIAVMAAHTLFGIEGACSNTRQGKSCEERSNHHKPKAKVREHYRV